MDTPLSAVNMTLSLSLLSSSMAFASSRVILGLGGCVFLRICLISPRSSSAFPFSSCRHAFSICETYSLTGGSLVVIAKFGPRASAFSCTSVRGSWIGYVPILSCCCCCCCCWDVGNCCCNRCFGNNTSQTKQSPMAQTLVQLYKWQ